MTGAVRGAAARLLAALVALAAVAYGAAVWCDALPNPWGWHYYPKVWMLAGCAGLLAAIRAGSGGD